MHFVCVCARARINLPLIYRAIELMRGGVVMFLVLSILDVNER